MGSRLKASINSILHRRLGLDSNPNLGKVSLPSRSESSYVDQTAVIAGYGFNSVDVRINPQTSQSEEYNGRSDNKLKYCMVDIISNEECTRKNYGDKIVESHMCGHAAERGRQRKGICRGDSGGPLFSGNTIIGVAITCPLGCTEHERASIYTRVSSFIGFIENAMEGTKTKDMLIHDIHSGASSSGRKAHGKWFGCVKVL